MLRLFRKKPKAEGLRALGERFVAPVAMAAAAGQIAAEHAAAIRDGRVPFPVHKSEGASLLRTWHDLRLEAMMAALNFGDGSLVDLAHVGKQMEVFTAFLDNKSHLRLPQPSGSPVDQSVQSMFQVYAYLEQVGTELGDPETDKHTLKIKGKDILSDIEADAIALRAEWNGFLNGGAGGLPRTLFDAFFEDVNRKTKSIAFARYFGPFYPREVFRFEDDLRAQQIAENDVRAIMATLDELRTASSPDEAGERTSAHRVLLPMLNG